MTARRLRKPTDGRGDITGVQGRGCHLVEQRLKEMMVALVDERDVHVCVTEAARGLEAAEAGAEDEDVRSRLPCRLL
jgi:hypothetical protein